MIELITRIQESIQALHDHIWKVVIQVMEKAGKYVADSLGITLHLVDMLPTIPLQLAFNTATARLPRCAPEVYAVQSTMGTNGLDFSYTSPPGSDQNAMTVLAEEILKSVSSTEEKAAQPTWLVTAAGKGTVEVQVVESKASVYPNHPHASCSPHHTCFLPWVGEPLGIWYHIAHHVLLPGAISRLLPSRLEIKVLSPFQLWV